jgi:hypothetical protein
MANKKRRKPANRPRPQGSVGTQEPPGRDEATAPPAEREPRNGHASGPSARSSARAEKKDLARRQREEVRRIVRRRRRARRLAIVGGIAIVATGALLWFTRSSGPATETNALPGLLRTQAPWPANSADALARADAINLPAHGTTLAMHDHVDLQIFVHGTPEQIPVDVGINDQGAASLHTHTSDGVVHIESGTVAKFTLGQFFDVWGVRFTPTCLGAYCNRGADELKAFVDGRPYTGDITKLPLDDQSVIVVTYGTQDELPNPIPSSFDFSTISP